MKYTLNITRVRPCGEEEVEKNNLYRSNKTARNLGEAEQWAEELIAHERPTLEKDGWEITDAILGMNQAIRRFVFRKK